MSVVASAVVLATLFKVLLFPSYHSTDFDVHRNWLAITHNLPVSEWYYENTSVWTLDYPPFFAFFEHVLSRFVPQSAIKDGCLRIVAEDGQYGWPTIAFQRSTVVLSEAVLVYALRFVDTVSALLVFLCPSWILLDHMHFQYNGAMYGLLLISIVCMQRKQFLRSAFLFSTLLCFKHLYLYVAPAYFAFLVRNYLLAPFKVQNVAKLGLVTLLPFALAIAPFKVSDYSQILSRLFPFARGLTHSYWAPNFWALYSFLDRVLGFVYKNSTIASTRGIVGQVEFANLPEISPKLTALIALFFQTVAMLFASKSTQFVECVCLCGFASFLFGYHVHEKAVMTVIVPFTLIALNSSAYLNAYLPLLAAGCCGIMPLIFTPAELFIKFVYTFGYLLVVYAKLPSVRGYKVSFLNKVYFLGLFVVMITSEILPLVLRKYEFAGTMLVSVYCASGVMFSWLQFMLAVFVYPQKQAVQEIANQGKEVAETVPVSKPRENTPKKQTKKRRTQKVR